MKERVWWIRPLAVLLVTLFIWSHSLAPAAESSEESGRFVALLAPFLKKINAAPELWQTLVRKAAHMTEFALLGLVWTAALLRRKAMSWPGRMGIAAAVSMATALIDETIQLFSPGRSGQISDVWVDLLGAVIGIALAAVVAGLIARRGAGR